jgi:riboflavin biosynthesis pyrimidine reductase
MRQLFPSPADDVDPAAIYGRMPPRADGLPAVRVNMIQSLDGAGSLAGRSGGLSGSADKALFGTLRAATDVVLVGAGTVRAEHYGPVRLRDAQRASRVDEGLSPVPPIAVVSGSCRLDVDTPFFTRAEARPVVVTVDAASPDERGRLAEVADVIVAGEELVDLRVALSALAERGWSNILAEGGPVVVGELATDDLIVELCVTLSPEVVVGDAPRIARGPAVENPARLRLLSLLEDDGFLFTRFGRDKAGKEPQPV